MKNIIEQNKSLVRAVIKKFTGSSNEDLEQDVYIKAWQNMNKFDAQNGKFSSWLGVLTANVCRDYFKSKFYHQNAEQVDDEVLENKTADNFSQEEILSSKERQKIILKAVDSLPKKLRQIIELYEFEELSYPEISKKLGLPQGTIKSRLFNARKILAEKLKFLQGE